jgi:hypothetical protein
MENKKFKTKLRYRASRDGWKRADFHRMSDKKGPTVTLFKIKENGQCVGGFTAAQWITPHHTDRFPDKKAILFNLSKESVFKCLYPS